MAEEQKRTFGPVDERGRSFHVFALGNQARVVAGEFMAKIVGERLRHHFRLRVLGDVDQHRTGTPRPRDVECLGHRLRHFVGGGNLEIPLGDGHRDADDVRLLKGIGSQQVLGNLTNDADHRRGVDDSVGDGRNQVGSPRPRSDQAHAYLARDTRVALGGVARALLVPHQNVVDLILIIVNGVVHGHNRPARIAKNGIHSLGQQGPDQRVGAVHQLGSFGQRFGYFQHCGILFFCHDIEN